MVFETYAFMLKTRLVLFIADHVERVLPGQIKTSHPILHRWWFESLFAKNRNPLYGFVT
jgi:hypothetical protein